MKLKTNKKVGSIGSGWHNESIPHSLAAKGMKVRPDHYTLINNQGKRISPVFEFPEQAEQYRKLHLNNSPSTKLWKIKNIKDLDNIRKK